MSYSSSASSSPIPSRSPTPEPFLDWFRRTDGNRRIWDSSTIESGPARRALDSFARLEQRLSRRLGILPPSGEEAPIPDWRLELLEEGVGEVGWSEPPVAPQASWGEEPSFGPVHPNSGQSLVEPFAHNELNWFAPPPSPGLEPTWFDQAVRTNWEPLEEWRYGYHSDEYRHNLRILRSPSPIFPLVPVLGYPESDESGGPPTPISEEELAALGLVELAGEERVTDSYGHVSNALEGTDW